MFFPGLWRQLQVPKLQLLSLSCSILYSDLLQDPGIIIIIIIIIHSFELFTSALADGFSLGSEWQQVSSSLQDSS